MRSSTRTRSSSAAQASASSSGGSGALLVRFDGAQAHDDAGRSTVRRPELPGTGNVVVQARLICDYEGEVSWAVGVTARQPFTVLTLEDPTRVVVDIKH